MDEEQLIQAVIEALEVDRDGVKALTKRELVQVTGLTHYKVTKALWVLDERGVLGALQKWVRMPGGGETKGRAYYIVSGSTENDENE